MTQAPVGPPPPPSAFVPLSVLPPSGPAEPSTPAAESFATAEPSSPGAAAAFSPPAPDAPPPWHPWPPPLAAGVAARPRHLRRRSLPPHPRNPLRQHRWHPVTRSI